MKRILIAAAAMSVLSGAAMAQPAYDPSQGGAPSDYPRCTHRGQDRCTQHGGWSHGHHHWKKHAHSSTDGERG